MDWFRMYHRVIYDPKIHRLSPAKRWRWVELLCISSMAPERGRLPSLDDIAFHMRLKLAEVKAIMDELIKVGLVDQVKGTNQLVIHDWEDYQKPSDAGYERVKRFRERQRNARETFHETLQERNCNVLEGERDRDTEGEEEKNPPLPPPIASLGPEYTQLGEYAIQLGADVSWGTWVTRQGLAGHKVEDIRAALEQASGAGKLTQPYVASILRGWAVEGRPKPFGRNGHTPSKPPPPPVDPEKLRPQPIRINERMSPKIKRISIEHNREHGFPDDGVIAS